MEVSEQRVRLPRHVSIIMDGNGRWASERGLPRHAGHKAGVGAVRSTVEQCRKYEIPVLTLFAFSSENWKRPQQEVGLLMELFLNALQREAKRLQKNDVRLRVIGDRGGFSEKLQAGIEAAESLTAGNTGLLLQIAANYGGRWDITEATRALARQAAAGELDPEAISEDTVSEALSFPGVPDPDLYIRTGGEQRLSNFLLWQAAYAELYFTPTLWPDFDAAAFDQALADFSRRQRRFGLVSEQLMVSHDADA
jgi:undecaprenyl diphosphate synthase